MRERLPCAGRAAQRRARRGNAGGRGPGRGAAAPVLRAAPGALGARPLLRQLRQDPHPHPAHPLPPPRPAPRAPAAPASCRPQEVEIEAARWLPLEEYAGQHFQRGVALYERMLERCVAWAEGRYSG
jgi:hypothetical protein